MGFSFCLECKNFEDRKDLDGNVVCAKGHYPRIACLDFKSKYTTSEHRARFCIECENFEDREDGPVCAKNHRPQISCYDYSESLKDAFYNYIYHASRYLQGERDSGSDHLEKNLARTLSSEELAYACLLEFFERWSFRDFINCWEVVGGNYGHIPQFKALQEAYDKYKRTGEKKDMVTVLREFLDLK